MKTQMPGFLVRMALILGLFAPTIRVRAGSLTVNSLADTIAADGHCTLREAIQNSNNNAATNADCAAGSGADTITFSVSGTILLGSYLPGILDAAGLTIDGAGQTVTISGHHAVSVLSVSYVSALTLNAVTIADGSTGIYGAGINNDGDLTITNSVFTGNHNSAYDGGAIYNQSATVNIINSTFTGNSAAHGGGGIYTLGGVVNITDSTFSGNTAANGGGVFCYNCNLTVTNSTFSANNTPNGTGGGIYSVYYLLTITDSIFSNNGASYGGGGGGVYSNYGGLNITNSQFTGNSAAGSPGGAILNGSTMDIRTSTFSDNHSGTGGGIYNQSGGQSTIANSTFTENSASDSSGGAIQNASPSYGNLTITNSTLAGNEAPSGGGIGNAGGVMRLRNTLVANNTGGNCSGAITNGGSNLDSGASCGWAASSGSMSNTNPVLGSLTGSPAYFPLSAGSPAIDQGDDTFCAAWPVEHQSQNGLPRPQAAHCDIGSYEAADTTPPVVQAITRMDANPTDEASVRFAVTFSQVVSGVDAGDFTLTVRGVTGAAISEMSGEGSAYVVTANTGSGSGTLRLDVTDNDSITNLGLVALGGAGAGNGDFSGGESYGVRLMRIYLPLELVGE